MLNPDFNAAQTYITALTGNPEHTMDFKCIHDTDKAVAAHTMRGTLREHWETLCRYNNQGWGIFTQINQLGNMIKPETGKILNELVNLDYIRAHCIDLDNTLTAHASYERASKWQPAPTFAVQTSPGKFHVYWCVEPYRGNDFYKIQQQKLRQFFDGDRNVVDATRVLRIPGFYHLKAQPFLIHGWGLSNTRTTAAILESALNHINIIDHSSGRFPLGEDSMTAPSFDWLKFAIHKIDPNHLERSEWLSFTAAFKQAGWKHADEPTLRAAWEEWCARYSGNNAGENLKLWNSIKDTEVGWPSIERRSTVKAYMMHGGDPAALLAAAQGQNAPPTPQPVQNASPAQKERPFDEIVDPSECARYFDKCFFVNSMGKILTPQGRFMDSTKFNGAYGGKHFIITTNGKTTNEAWTAALKSTAWTIPKVDHVRFLPSEPPYTIVKDEMDRDGINTYIPPKIQHYYGDISPFLDWLARILPDQNDRNLLCSYLAHCVKFPGFKIPWCPLLQGAKGIGKTIIGEVMTYALGSMYVYEPPAPELVKTGSTFNSWMKDRLLIIVDEIKIDERRELAEILKPFITQHRIQIQFKGVDQQMEDNVANWIAFSNFLDAIPIDEDERRYAIFYSILQSYEDILAAGMDKAYFQRLWDWLREGGGKQMVTHWLLNYPIEKGGLDIRAPKTSSTEKAIRLSRSPMEITIRDSIADSLPGFRGGYISTLAVLSRVKAAGIRTPAMRSIESCIEKMGYVQLGRAPRSYAQEDVSNRTTVYANRSDLDINMFGRVQGYE